MNDKFSRLQSKLASIGVDFCDQTSRQPESTKKADDLDHRLDVLDAALENHIDKQNKEFFGLRDNVHSFLTLVPET